MLIARSLAFATRYPFRLMFEPGTCPSFRSIPPDLIEQEVKR
jgi:hypothetical protein